MRQTPRPRAAAPATAPITAPITALATALAVAAALAAPAAQAEKYGLKDGKPYEGTPINILSVVTPQFDGLKLRDEEFTELTGIETE